MQVVARCVTVPRRAFSNASRSDEMRYCASPSCDELTSSIKVQANMFIYRIEIRGGGMTG